MFLCNREMYGEYIDRGDQVGFLLCEDAIPLDERFASHKWLKEAPEKRMIYWNMYRDIVESRNLKILDVGGGYCSITRKFLLLNDYFLLDPMYHDDPSLLKKVEKQENKKFWINSDWKKFEFSSDFDLIVANDLFPNVDQRLEEFLEKYLPRCTEMRIALTYYNNNRTYKVKRIDADEVFHILAWDNLRLLRVLEKYKTRIEGFDPEVLLCEPESIFTNGRQVCIVKIAGAK